MVIDEDYGYQCWSVQTQHSQLQCVIGLMSNYVGLVGNYMYEQWQAY